MNKMTHVCFAACMVLAVAWGTVSAAQAEALELRNNRLFLPVSINGVRAEALLDSAAEMTFIDPKLARELGLKAGDSTAVQGSGGQASARFAEGVAIEAAGVRLTNLTVAILDMTDLSQRLVGSPLRIILGREFFDAGRIEINMTRGSIRKLDPTFQPKGTRLPLTSQRGIESMPCKVDGVATLADLDLGNGSEVLIGQKFAESRGLLAPGRVIERKSGGGIGGAIERDIIELGRLELAGVQFEKVRAAVDRGKTAGDLNLGTSILRRFVLIIDFPGRAVWLQPQ